MTRRKQRRRRGGRTTPRGGHRGPTPPPRPPFVGEVEELLAEASPLPLLQMASGLVETTTRRLARRLSGEEGPFDGAELLVSFVDSGLPELRALARAMVTLRPDELGEARLRRAGPLTGSAAPPWLAAIGDVEIEGTISQQHLLGDGENVLIGWRWPGGAAATAVVYIDHNLGTMAKDAFVVDEDIASLQATYDELSGPGMTRDDIDPADARARVAEAIDTYEHTLGAPESDTWPVSRPLVEWIVGLLPEGGIGFTRPEWSEADRQGLSDDFLASPHAAIDGLAPGDVAELFEPLVWFGCDYGPGDPLRWSPASVEIVLADWYPRKVLGTPSALLQRLPDVLGGFIRYAHQRRRIPAELTASTLEAIEITSSRVGPGGDMPDLGGLFDLDDLDDLVQLLDDDGDGDHGVESLLGGEDTRGGGGPFDPDDIDGLVVDLEAMVIDLVGGPDNYARLDDRPLGDAPFDWAGIPDGVRDLTAATLDDLDRWAVDLFDAEVRTIARAVLAAVVATDPATFRRSSNTANLAAAILGHLLHRLTGRLSKREKGQLPWRVHTVKALSEATGVSASNISNRSKTVAKVVDRAGIEWAPILHSIQRREALDTKESIRAWRATQS